MSKKCQISSRHSNSPSVILDEETYESTPNIFCTSFFWDTHQFFLPHFFVKPTNFPTSFSWETHQFFLPHFLGKPTNFSYLVFLGNPPIFPTSFSWETHQFFLPHFFWETHHFSTSFSWEPTNFSYNIFFGKSWDFFLGYPPIWLMKLLKKLHLMRFLATISVIIWNFSKLFTMKEGTIDAYKTTSPLLSYLIRVLRNSSLKI